MNGSYFVKSLLASTMMLALPLQAQDPLPVTAIRCGKFFDGRTLSLQENLTLLIQVNRISAVGRELSIPAGAKVIDLSHATVMPGLIDSHTHMFLAGIDYDELL